MPGLSNWREEFNLSEVVTGKMTDKEALKKVSEKSGINNKVTINPKLDEAVKEIGGEVIGMVEQDTTAQKQRIDMKQMILDRQKLKIRRKDLSAAKKEQQNDVEGDSTNASKQSNVIAQEAVQGQDTATRKAMAGERKAGDKRVAPGKAKQNAERVMQSVRFYDKITKGKHIAGVAEEEVVIERLGGKGYQPYTDLRGKKISGDWEDSDRGKGNKAKRRAGGKVEKKSPTYRAHVLNKEEVEDLNEYSPNVTYQAKGGKKSGKLGKSSVYSLRGKDESKKDFRKSQVKDIKGGYLKTEGYEEKKTSEVLAAFKRDPKVRKRFEKAAKKEDGPGSVKNRAADSMLQTAKDTAKRKGDTSKSDDRYAYEETILEKDLNAAERRALPNKDFALPGKGKGPEGKQAGSYPIPDEKHARSALSLVAQHGTPEEKATVRAKVKKKFPEIQQEGVMKFVKSIGKKKKVEKKPSMDSITTKVHQWRKDREKEERRKYVSDFDPIDEAKVDTGKSPEEKEKDRNVRRFGVSHNVAGHGKLRRALHRSDRGYKKKKGDKSQYVEMEATDKAFEFVKNKLKAKYGDGVLTTGEKMKPPTAAQKKAAAAHQAKVDKENAAERAKDPSQGRYPKG